MTPSPHELEQIALQGGWVEGLARSLVRDAHRAEDLVQDAWVEVLQHGSKSSGALAGWMAGTMRNLARGKQRSEARRSRREREAARPEALPPADQGVQRLEQQALLIQAVLGLPEPYRSAILRRYVDGVPPRKLAQELQVPVATIQSRLTRGLKLLRTELMQAHGDDESRWLAAMLPLTGLSSPWGAVLFGVTLMNLKPIVAAAVLLVFSAAFLMRGDPPTLQRPEVSQGSALETDLQGLGAGPMPASSRVHDPGTEREPASRPNAAADSGQLLIRVVHGRTGLPVSEAKLYLSDGSMADTPDAEDLASISMLQFHPEGRLDWLRRLGPDGVTDARGHLRVSMPEQDVGVLAEWQGARGHAVGRAGVQQELRIELWPSAEVLVRVQDEDGNPLTDMPVALRASESNYSYVTQRASTGAKGYAILRWALMPYPEGQQPTLEVVLDAPFPVLPSKPLRLVNDRAEVDLVCPAYGSVSIELWKTESERIPDGSVIFLQAANPRQQSPMLLAPGLIAARVQAGVVRFDYVGLGQELELKVPLAWNREHWGMLFEGPTQRTEELRRRVVVGAEIHAFRGVVEDSSGVPLPGESFLVSHDAGNGSAHQWSLESDDQGRFELELIGLEGRLSQGSLRFKPQAERDSRIEVLRNLEELGTGDPVDLGRIDLRTEPSSMCGGYVFGPDGAAVAGASVGLATADGLGGFRKKLRPVLSDAKGRFDLYGDYPGGEVWIRAFTQGRWRHEPVRLSGPSQSLELRLFGSGSLEGKLLADDGVSFENVWLNLWDLSQGPSGSLQAKGWNSFGVASDGSFAESGLEPGAYDLSVSLTVSGQVLARIPGLRVSDDGTSDARLQPLDLRGMLRSLQVELLNAQGLRVPAKVWLVEDGGRLSALGRGPQISMAKDVEGAFVAVPDYGLPGVARLGSATSYTLCAPAAREIELCWSDASGSAPEAVEFSIELIPMDFDQAPPGLRAAWELRHRLAPLRVSVAPGQTSRIKLPELGRYRQRWMASLEGPNGSEQLTWEAPRTGASVLSVTARLGSFDVTPGADWLAGLTRN